MANSGGRERPGGNPRASSRTRGARPAPEPETPPGADSGAAAGASLSIRLIALGVLALLIAFVLVPTVFDWWQQEREYDALVQEVEETESANEEMRRQLEQWEDSDYVASQARSRLGYVKEGETRYTVVDPGEDYQDEDGSGEGTSTDLDKPWVQVLAESVAAADSPEE